MIDRILHLHEPRLGLGLPARTSRPFRRAGEGVVEAFCAAVAKPAERVVLTGRLFDRDSPPAHLVDRIVRPLGELAARGIAVSVPRSTPRALLFLAAGVKLDDPELPGPAPEFWRAGGFRILLGDRVLAAHADLPGSEEVALDVTGLTGAGVLARIEKRLAKVNGARFVRLVLTGKTDDPRVLAVGAKELHAFLPPGVDGVVVRDYERPDGNGKARDEDGRVAALAAARARIPELPETTGVYELLDAKGRALYVGKAVNLRRRVASHYTAEVREASPRGPMLAAVHAVRTLPAASELEALLLEARRIREARPAWNRQMRDPEGSRYVRADLDAAMPSLTAEARRKHDHAVWYGPFPKRWIVERSLRVLQVVYGLASCSWRPGTAAPAACTDRDLGICTAPCVDRIGIPGYRERVALATDHLLGHETGAPPFGALNSLATGSLGDDDLAVLDAFSRSVRRFVAGLRSATGLLELPSGRALLVLGGLVAEEWTMEPGTEEEVRARAAERIAAWEDEPPPTWVPAERADEARILVHWFRTRVASQRAPAAT